MTISIRTLLTIGVTALVSSGITVFVAGLERATASPATTYRLRLGDYVQIPALDWTCAETALPKARVDFLTCNTNDKPISEVNIYPAKIVVSARSTFKGTVGGVPVSVAHGGYLFHYRHQ